MTLKKDLKNGFHKFRINLILFAISDYNEVVIPQIKKFKKKKKKNSCHKFLIEKLH
jgi:hypothetical protein